jgi:hypothetical protein
MDGGHTEFKLRHSLPRDDSQSILKSYLFKNCPVDINQENYTTCFWGNSYRVTSI